MAKNIAFCIKVRPFGVDCLDDALKMKFLFVGYPAFRTPPDAMLGPNDVEDVSKQQFKWEPSHVPREIRSKKEISNYGTQIAKISNIAKEADDGSYAIVPRFERNIFYVARVRKFSNRGVDALTEAVAQRLKDKGVKVKADSRLLCEAVQGWRIVGDVREIRADTAPGWLKGRLGQRAAIGRVYHFDEFGDATAEAGFAGVTHFLADGKPSGLADRMRWYFSPTSFEFHVLDLLRRHAPSIRWQHVGGVGDGGVDIVGQQGSRVHAVQCKYSASKKAIQELVEAARKDLGEQGMAERALDKSPPPLLCVLSDLPDGLDETEVWGLQTIARKTRERGAKGFFAYELGLKK